jgi:hypothetical protein
MRSLEKVNSTLLYSHDYKSCLIFSTIRSVDTRDMTVLLGLTWMQFGYHSQDPNEIISVSVEY